VSLLVCALPALLAAEASGGDAAAGAELASTWLGEFVGTAVMVLCTCSPGALIGHAGEWAEYLLHYGMMVLADYSCGGPHVNPCVTVAIGVRGPFGRSKCRPGRHMVDERRPPMQL